VGTVLILVYMAGKDLNNIVLRDYLLFCIALLGWQSTESLFFILDQPILLERDHNIKLIFIALTGVLLFRIVVGFYKIHKIPNWVTYAVFAIPVITAVIGLTDLSHTLLMTDFEVTSTYPLNEAVITNGIWFQVNAIFTNLMVASVLIIIVIMLFRLPKAYRPSSVGYLAALLLYAAGYVASFMIETYLDVIMIGVSLGNLAIYFVITKSERGDYLSLARREIFNYLDEAVFILDEKNRIVDSNKSAKEWLMLMGKESKFITFDGMIENLEGEGLIKTTPSETDNSMKIRLVHKDIPLIFEMNEIVMHNDSGYIKGKFVTLEDVTRTSLFIDRLEIDAGIDPLTGLQNRYTYEELLTDLNKEENLPISVILGDVNSLKYINDNYGHMAGDSLLSSVGEVIKDCCPRNGFAARIGGDEFVIMVPRCDEHSIQKIADGIRNKIENIKEKPFEVKMALGCVTKKTIDGSLKDMVHDADKVMYFNKTKLKEAKE